MWKMWKMWNEMVERLTTFSNMFERRSPFKFSSLVIATRNSRAVILVGLNLAVGSPYLIGDFEMKLELSSLAQHCGISFNDADKDFCQSIFLPSTNYLLGPLIVSPILSRFRHIWNRTFFKEALRHGCSIPIYQYSYEGWISSQLVRLLTERCFRTSA